MSSDPPRPNPMAAPLTAERLEAAALFYLERFATSSAHLRLVLWRRMRRAAARQGVDAVPGAPLIDALIARYLAAGLLDDRAYAEARTASLHRRGASARTIAAALDAKGIARPLREALLRRADDPAARDLRPGGDLAAAAALARRRRLGPYRPEESRAATQAKDLAALARAGFGRKVALRLLGCTDPAAVEELLSRDG